MSLDLLLHFSFWAPLTMLYHASFPRWPISWRHFYRKKINSDGKLLKLSNVKNVWLVKVCALNFFALALCLLAWHNAHAVLWKKSYSACAPSLCVHDRWCHRRYIQKSGAQNKSHSREKKLVELCLALQISDLFDRFRCCKIVVAPQVTSNINVRQYRNSFIITIQFKTALVLNAWEFLEIEPRVVNKFPKRARRVLIKSRWRVKLDDVSCLQHHNSVTIEDCVQTVCNSQHRTLRKVPPNCRLNQEVRSEEAENKKKIIKFTKSIKNFMLTRGPRWQSLRPISEFCFSSAGLVPNKAVVCVDIFCVKPLWHRCEKNTEEFFYNFIF